MSREFLIREKALKSLKIQKMKIDEIFLTVDIINKDHTYENSVVNANLFSLALCICTFSLEVLILYMWKWDIFKYF